MYTNIMIFILLWTIGVGFGTLFDLVRGISW